MRHDLIRAQKSEASIIPSSREGKALALDVFPAILSADRGSRDAAGCMWSTEVLCLLGVWCMERACVCGLSAIRLWCMCVVCISVHGICESVCGEVNCLCCIRRVVCVVSGPCDG